MDHMSILLAWPLGKAPPSKATGEIDNDCQTDLVQYYGEEGNKAYILCFRIMQKDQKKDVSVKDAFKMLLSSGCVAAGVASKPLMTGTDFKGVSTSVRLKPEFNPTDAIQADGRIWRSSAQQYRGAHEDHDGRLMGRIAQFELKASGLTKPRFKFTAKRGQQIPMWDTLFTSNAEVIKYDSENTNIWKDIDSTVVAMLEGALDSRKQARVKLTDERQLNGMYSEIQSSNTNNYEWFEGDIDLSVEHLKDKTHPIRDQINTFFKIVTKGRRYTEMIFAQFKQEVYQQLVGDPVVISGTRLIDRRKLAVTYLVSERKEIPLVSVFDMIQIKLGPQQVQQFVKGNVFGTKWVTDCKSLDEQYEQYGKWVKETTDPDLKSILITRMTQIRELQSQDESNIVQLFLFEQAQKAVRTMLNYEETDIAKTTRRVTATGPVPVFMDAKLCESNAVLLWNLFSSLTDIVESWKIITGNEMEAKMVISLNYTMQSSK